MSQPKPTPEELRETLKAALDQAEWGWIENHALRDGVIVAAPEMDLIEVGLHIAQDDSKTVGAWVNSGKVFKPRPDQLETWRLDPQRKFKCLVLQPYVLIQEFFQ
jgi:hypothetical protein